MSDQTKESQETGSDPLRSSITKLPQSPNYRDIYFNLISIGTTTWDVRLTLSLIKEIEQAPESGIVFRAEDQATIFTSLPHFKAMTLASAEFLERYEKENGQIPMPNRIGQ